MKYLFLAIFMLPALTWASGSGSTVGNGGNAVVCYDSHKKVRSVELYDFVEARLQRHLPQKLGSPKLSVEEKIELALTRIDRWNPSRAFLYRRLLKEFSQETQYVSGVDLIHVPDDGVAYVPVSCELKQLALQKEPTFPGDKRYTINLDLFKRLDRNSQAGLILHELIYREAIQDGAKSSMGVRYFLGMVAADALRGLHYQQYVKLLQMAGLRWADTHDRGFAFKLFELGPAGERYDNDIRFQNEDYLLAAPCPYEDEYDRTIPRKLRFQGREYKIKDMRDGCGWDVPDMPNSGAYSFLQDGRTRQFGIEADKVKIETPTFQGELTLSRLWLNGSGLPVNFGLDPKGLKAGSPLGEFKTKFMEASLTLVDSISQYGGFNISFNENGEVKSFELYPLENGARTPVRLNAKVKNPFDGSWMDNVTYIQDFSAYGMPYRIHFDHQHPYALQMPAQARPILVSYADLLGEQSSYWGTYVYYATAAERMDLLSNRGMITVQAGEPLVFDRTGLLQRR